MPKKKTNDVKAEIKKITKKKKRKVYFGQEVQDAVVDYNSSVNNDKFEIVLLILSAWLSTAEDILSI